MYVEQMYTDCLAEAAYYIESNGEAIVVDPMRETSPYVELAAERGAKIKYVFETHFHADFVSGHVDLARRTGAQIVYGPTAVTGFDSIIAHDEQLFHFGDVKIKVLHTPGHTPESSSYLLYDEDGKEHAAFTGDTLFIGEVGRPDLAVKSDLTKEDLAGMLFESLHDKLMVLPDDVLVYPAHGAGSACGKNISDEKFSTIGEQRKLNYALQPMSRKDFIAKVTDGIMAPPQYFPKNAKLNKYGYADIDEILERNTVAMSPKAVKAAMEDGAILLDTRPIYWHNIRHVEGSIFVGLEGSYASWVGTLIEDLDQPIIVLTMEGQEEEAVLRLARVGYHNVLGYLEGGVHSWKDEGLPMGYNRAMNAHEFALRFKEGEVNVLDVRKPTEFAAEHIEDATSFPLDFINKYMHDMDKDKTWYVNCKGGYRSTIAISLMKKNGYKDLVNIDGGFDAILEADIPVTDYVCPSTITA